MRSQWDTLVKVFIYFVKSSWASEPALAIYIGGSFFPTIGHRFRSFFLKRCPSDVTRCMVSASPSRTSHQFLFPIFVEFCIEWNSSLMRSSDSAPWLRLRTSPNPTLGSLLREWWNFPFARVMKRKVVYHCGPTNNEKTYTSMQQFMEASKGIYCSPLRPLTMEVLTRWTTLGLL